MRWPERVIYSNPQNAQGSATKLMVWKLGAKIFRNIPVVSANYTYTQS